MLRRIHVTNAQGRDADVAMADVPREELPRLGLEGHQVSFRRYVAATQPSRHQSLQKKWGADYASALIEGDPEVDLEREGRTIAQTSVVYLDSKGDPLSAAPRLIETIFGADGVERERREPRDAAANVNEETALRWTGRKIPVRDAVRQYCFRRTIQLFHVDALTFDFLHAIARQLHTERVVVLLGAGPKGNDPLVFEANGRPYRGFLSGRLHPDDPNRYRLLLHLSDMELKAPVPLAEPLVSEATETDVTSQDEPSASELAEPSTPPPASPSKLSVAALLGFEGEAESDGLVPLDPIDDEPVVAKPKPTAKAAPKAPIAQPRERRDEPAGFAPPVLRPDSEQDEVAPESAPFEPPPVTKPTGVIERATSTGPDRRARNTTAHMAERESADVMVAVSPPRKPKPVASKPEAAPPVPSSSKAPASDRSASKSERTAASSKPKLTSSSKAKTPKSSPSPKSKPASKSKPIEEPKVTKKAAPKTSAKAASSAKKAAPKSAAKTARKKTSAAKPVAKAKRKSSSAPTIKKAATKPAKAKSTKPAAVKPKPAKTQASKTAKASTSKPAVKAKASKTTKAKASAATKRVARKSASKPRKGAR